MFNLSLIFVRMTSSNKSLKSIYIAVRRESLIINIVGRNDTGEREEL